MIVAAAVEQNYHNPGIGMAVAAFNEKKAPETLRKSFKYKGQIADMRMRC